MRAAILLSVMMLAACSGQQGGGGNAAANGAATSGSESGMTTAATASLNLTDACAVLPGDRVAQTLGLPLNKADLRDVMTDSGNGMSSSRCVYDFPDGLASLNLERFPNGSDMASIFSGTRSLLARNGSVAIEDVPGLGERAFWVAEDNNLYIMLDDNRQIVLATARLDVAGTKDKLIALARTILG